MRALTLLLTGIALCCATATTFAAETEEGFKPLFNGENLEGWVGDVDGYVVKDGKIICDPKTGGNLYTEKQYANFVIRFDFKLPPGANNGLGIRAPLSGNTAYQGMELQILDDTADRYKDLEPYQYHGSLYGLVAAKRGHLKPVGEWNSQEVRLQGDQLEVILNGETILKADLEKVRSEPTLDGKEHPGLNNKTGHIGFLGHGSAVEFRNLRIKELAE